MLEFLANAAKKTSEGLQSAYTSVTSSFKTLSWTGIIARALTVAVSAAAIAYAVNSFKRSKLSDKNVFHGPLMVGQSREDLNPVVDVTSDEAIADVLQAAEYSEVPVEAPEQPAVNPRAPQRGARRR